MADALATTSYTLPPVRRDSRRPLQLQGATAVVTGAASGIGAATALRLAKAGCNVCLIDVQADAAASTAAAIRSVGADALVIPADVRSPAAIEDAYTRTLRHFGRVDVLVNSAGVLRVGPALECSDAAWQHVVNVNMWGVVQASLVFGRHFADIGHGHIVNISSAAGLSGLPYSAAYATSKFAVVGFSESLRWELADYGVGVTVVCPGAVRTAIAHGSGGPRTAELVEKFGAEVAPLADKIVRAISRNQARVIYGAEPRVWGALRWVSPRLHDRAGKALARMRREKQLF